MGKISEKLDTFFLTFWFIWIESFFHSIFLFIFISFSIQKQHQNNNYSTIISIGNNPFAQLTSLKSIQLNNNDNFVFENDCLYDKNKTRLINCLSNNKRTSFTIPATVKTIDSYSFSSSSLESITIHDNIEEIGTYAFYLSNKLSIVQIGKNVKIIGANPFVNTPLLSEIIISDNNTFFKMVDGVLMDINQTTIITYLKTKNNQHYDIPESVIKLNSNSFSRNLNIKSITIPSNVNYIASNAFLLCSNLQTITFKGKKQPSTCHTTAFDSTHPELVINVPNNYEGNTFCNKTVTKSLTSWWGKKKIQS